MAFKRRKFNDTKQYYSIHEKIMMIVVHCMHVRCHYLSGSPFTIYIDNIATNYFNSQKKQNTPKQVCWQDFLFEYDLSLWYKSWRTNVVTNILSYKDTPDAMTIVLTIISNLLDVICVAYATTMQRNIWYNKSRLVRC